MLLPVGDCSPIRLRATLAAIHPEILLSRQRLAPNCMHAVCAPIAQAMTVAFGSATALGLTAQMVCAPLIGPVVPFLVSSGHAGFSPCQLWVVCRMGFWQSFSLLGCCCMLLQYVQNYGQLENL